MVSLDLSHILTSNQPIFKTGARRDAAMATLDRLSRDVDTECGGHGYWCQFTHFQVYATSLLEAVQAELAAAREALGWGYDCGRGLVCPPIASRLCNSFDGKDTDQCEGEMLQLEAAVVAAGAAVQALIDALRREKERQEAAEAARWAAEEAERRRREAEEAEATRRQLLRGLSARRDLALDEIEALAGQKGRRRRREKVL